MPLTTDEQIARIQGVFNGALNCPDYTFRFGQYAGRSLEWVYHTDKKYLTWCYHSDIKLPLKVITFIEESLVRKESGLEDHP